MPIGIFVEFQVQDIGFRHLLNIDPFPFRTILVLAAAGIRLAHIANRDAARTWLRWFVQSMLQEHNPSSSLSDRSRRGRDCGDRR